MFGRQVSKERDGRREVFQVVDVNDAGHLMVTDERGQREEWVSRVEFELL